MTTTPEDLQLHTAIATFSTELQGFRDLVTVELAGLKSDVRSVKADTAETKKQVKETNGRVTKLETKRAFDEGALSSRKSFSAGLMAILMLLATLVSTGFGVLAAHALGAA